jgi:hypothetical protein
MNLQVPRLAAQGRIDHYRKRNSVRVRKSVFSYYGNVVFLDRLLIMDHSAWNDVNTVDRGEHKNLKEKMIYYVHGLDFSRAVHVSLYPLLVTVIELSSTDCIWNFFRFLFCLSYSGVLVNGRAPT